MPHATIDGVRFHYETAGDGDAVLLISGLSAPSVGWAYQVKALAPSYRVVTFDNRGVGETDLAPGLEYPTARMADDAAGILRHLGIKRAHVIGASMGGTIAQELALRHPRLVRSLVIACSWARADARFLSTIKAWVALASRVPVEERYRYVLYPWLWSPELFANPRGLESVLERTLAYPHQTKPEAIERQARGLLAWNGTRVRRLSSIKVPALVLVGRDDILTPPAFSRELARLLPNARLRVLPGGHAFFLEHADAFNAAVLRFLRSVRSP